MKKLLSLLFILFQISCNNGNENDNTNKVNSIDTIKQIAETPVVNNPSDTFDSKAFKNNLDILRTNYTNELHTRLLDLGLDVKFITKEKKGKKILIMQNPMFNDVWLRKFQKDYIIVEALGYYDRVILSDGYDYQSSSY